MARAYQSLRATQTIDVQQQLLGEGRYDEALALLEAALKLQPQHPDLWEDKGRVMMLMSKLDEAKAAYQTSDRIAPNSDGACGLHSLETNN